MNNFFLLNSIRSVIDFGCGDSSQIEKLNCREYLGVDISRQTIEACRKNFSARPGWRFMVADELPADQLPSDLALSLDVIYHLVEDDVYERYMAQLFASASRFVIVYSSDWDQTARVPHVRHRWFTAWIARKQPQWQLAARYTNPYALRENDELNTTFASFVIFNKPTSLNSMAEAKKLL